MRRDVVDASLKGEGIYVIDHSEIPAKAEVSLATVVRKQDVDVLKAFWDSQFKKARSYDHVFLCWENFCGDLSTFHANRLTVWDLIKQSLPADINLQFILFFRRQDSFVQSAYAQFMQQGYVDGFDALLSTEYRKGFDWWCFLNDLKSVFPDATVHPFPYDEAVLRRFPISQLVGDVIGSEYLKRAEAEISPWNVGMTHEAMRIFKKTSPLLRDRVEQKLLRKKLQQYFNKGLYTEYRYLSADEKKEMYECYKESNERMFETYWKEKFGMGNYTAPLALNSNKTNLKEFSNESSDAYSDTMIRLSAYLINDINQLENANKKLNSGIFRRIKGRLRKLIG